MAYHNHIIYKYIRLYLDLQSSIVFLSLKVNNALAIVGLYIILVWLLVTFVKAYKILNQHN